MFTFVVRHSNFNIKIVTFLLSLFAVFPSNNHQNLQQNMSEAMNESDAQETDNDKADAKWISLNVGGKVFLTTLSTLTNKEPNCMLAKMFSHESRIKPSCLRDGSYLIDRSSQYFEPIINYLRHGQLIRDDGLSLDGILEEARFFGIDGLIPRLEELIAISHNADNMPLTRRDVVSSIIQTAYLSELRFQGVNLAGADLSKLDLRNINFKVGFCGCMVLKI